MIFVLATIVQPLVDVADWILRFFHHNLGFSWGASIIGMTIVVRLAILPITYKGIRGMQAMQRLQPELKRIQERFKGDKQRIQQETMKLWQEHNVNPLGSCLPFALQIPFFIALFSLLRSAGFRHEIAGQEQFLFIPSLSQPVTHHPPVLAALIGLYIVTAVGSAMVTAISADKNQRLLAIGLPVFFVIPIIRFPAGVIVYWITTNVWTIGQQIAVKKLLPAPALTPTDAKVTDPEHDPAKALTAVGADAAAEGDGERSRWSLFGALGAGSSPSDGDSANGKDGASARGPAEDGASARGTATKARAGARTGAPADGRSQKAPPPRSPRKKKKRSGRRR